MRATLALFACLGSLVFATSASANPVIPQNLPDPTVLKVGDDFYASGTSGSWAPLFPLWHSKDLRSWRRIGSVLPRAPQWARGAFWAPELDFHDGRFLLYYSAAQKRGRTCLAVASAARIEGPWREDGRVLCRPGGVIDVSRPVTDEDGRRWIAWKAMGVGGALHVQRLSADGRGVTGAEHRLLGPEPGWERGVTEGPALIRRDGWWYLFYSGGNCCRPPCTYAEGVARSRTLTGPFAKHPDNPRLRGTERFKCLGHGTLVDDADGSLHLLHHGYLREDVSDRRRQVFLSRVEWGDDGWPSLKVADTPAATPSGWSDGFRGRRLRTGWEWPFDRVPAHRVGASSLRMRCDGRTRLVARQVELDAFTAVVTTRAGAVAGFAPNGVVRGVEVRGGRARAFREGEGPRRTGRWTRVSPGGRVLVSFTADGVMSATVGSTAVDTRVAATGLGPIRLALGCRDARGEARFDAARVRAEAQPRGA